MSLTQSHVANMAINKHTLINLPFLAWELSYPAAWALHSLGHFSWFTASPQSSWCIYDIINSYWKVWHTICWNASQGIAEYKCCFAWKSMNKGSFWDVTQCCRAAVKNDGATEPSTLETCTFFLNYSQLKTHWRFPIFRNLHLSTFISSELLQRIELVDHCRDLKNYSVGLQSLPEETN